MKSFSNWSVANPRPRDLPASMRFRVDVGLLGVAKVGVLRGGDANADAAGGLSDRRRWRGLSSATHGILDEAAGRSAGSGAGTMGVAEPAAASGADGAQGFEEVNEEADDRLVELRDVRRACGVAGGVGVLPSLLSWSC